MEGVEAFFNISVITYSYGLELPLGNNGGRGKDTLASLSFPYQRQCGPLCYNRHKV
jgi:hypothetical protein